MFIRYQGFTESGFGLCLCSSLDPLNYSPISDLSPKQDAFFFWCWTMSNTIYRVLLHYCLRISAAKNTKEKCKFLQDYPSSLAHPYLHSWQEGSMDLSGRLYFT